MVQFLLPNTVDVRFAAVLLSVDLLLLLMTGFGLRKIFSSAFLTTSGIGDDLFLSSFFGESLRFLAASLRLQNRNTINHLLREKNWYACLRHGQRRLWRLLLLATGRSRFIHAAPLSNAATVQ